MEEKKAYGLVMTFVAVFVVFLASVMSYSLWRDKQINAFMATNRAWGIQCDRSSQAAWVIRNGERTALEMNNMTLYCHGFRFEGRTDPETKTVSLDKYSVYQHISRQPN